MSRLFIGGLKEGASRTELEKEFESFGPLREVWIARRPPGFGFVLFECQQHAENALRDMNGQYVCGGRIRVEHARDSGAGSRGSRSSGGECYNCGRYGHNARDCKKGTSANYGYNGGSGSYRRRSRSRSFERDSRRHSSRREYRRSPSRSRSRERRR